MINLLTPLSGIVLSVLRWGVTVSDDIGAVLLCRVGYHLYCLTCLSL